MSSTCDELLVFACGVCDAGTGTPCAFTLEARPQIHAERLFHHRFAAARRQGGIAFAAMGMRPDDLVTLGDDHGR